MLKPSVLVPLTTREIRPRGWLRRQLEIQAAGLCGNLDRVWPDIRDSRWVGGDRDGWERVPYWLDGFIPLAYLLEDEELIGRAKRYVDAILSRQEPDGWLCPCAPEERRRYDMWALILIAKVLVLYADCSGDERIEEALSRALFCFNRHLDGATLFDWGAARWFECLIPIFWLYERTGESWLLDLARKLEVEGMDYGCLFADYRDQEPRRRWSYLTHVVNLAMCLKQQALTSRLSGGDTDGFAETALGILLRHHGMAVGHFTGDECVSGDSPIQGTELCGVVEAMYSYETLLAAGGSAVWGDRLERLAFNALPAALSEDMWTHQYVQMTNQVECSRLPDSHVVFRTNGADAHQFGLEPNFGCCTANFGQGWPKLALSAFMRTERGLASAVLVPSEARVVIDGAEVFCLLETEYPFRGRLTYTVRTARPVSFELQLRIPGFAAAASVDGRPVDTGAFYSLERRWEGESRVTVELVFACELTPRPRELYCLWRGPLLYALPLKERWEKREYVRDGVERRSPYCDYEVYGESPWNYGFADHNFTVRERQIGGVPFSRSAPPVTVEAVMAPVAWPFAHGVCAAGPEGREPLGPPQRLELIPYGCTSLRMAEMPRTAPAAWADRG